MEQPQVEITTDRTPQEYERPHRKNKLSPLQIIAWGCFWIAALSLVLHFAWASTFPPALQKLAAKILSTSSKWARLGDIVIPGLFISVSTLLGLNAMLKRDAGKTGRAVFFLSLPVFLYYGIAFIGRGWSIFFGS